MDPSNDIGFATNLACLRKTVMRLPIAESGSYIELRVNIGSELRSRSYVGLVDRFLRGSVGELARWLTLANSICNFSFIVWTSISDLRVSTSVFRALISANLILVA